ncbi:hypothetical protein EYF80_014074 [Liparis tanakae]|uniref:Uncharacterized protein n=1 Tax=Liparis tanakae TaxID=230148 RepID=A0A4Z2IDA4_9TELE|nr:hypothetical protein EYF80_014074 [Liparis tanakae]
MSDCVTSGRPYLMFSAMLVAKRMGSWLTTPIKSLSSSGAGKGLDVRRGLTQSERSDKHHEEHLKTHKPVLATATFFFSLTLI